jgi:hypothetical protein
VIGYHIWRIHPPFRRIYSTSVAFAAYTRRLGTRCRSHPRFPTQRWFLMPSKRSSNARKPQARTPSTPSAPTSIPQHSFLVDSSIPYHFVNDRSFFVSFSPTSQIFRTPFGRDVPVDGYGSVDLYFVAFGQLHAFRLTCAYTPSIPNHLFSSFQTIKSGNQLLLSSRPHVGRPGQRFPNTSS